MPQDSFVSAAYDRYACVYDWLFGLVLEDGRQLLGGMLNTKPGDRIVEFGVGSGLMLRFYPRHTKVLGLDLSRGMLARANARVQRENLHHVSLQWVDAEHTGIEEASFDHVILPYVYSVTPNPLALMEVAHRVCQPGGSIWILNHFSGLGVWDWLERPLKPFARWIGFRPDFPYSKYVTEQGWNVVGVYKANLFGLSRLVHIRRLPADTL
jgi:phosphatidylethanolamine/phosphatidyl-N-methylethanolamine N-methyltransferase